MVKVNKNMMSIFMDDDGGDLCSDLYMEQLIKQ
jgi:hypothetical protein